MRIVFMGTPDFAVPTLETLIQSEHEVVGVVTQPDRPKGRSGKLQFSPVKEAAVEAQIPVFQPERIKDGTFYPVLQELNPDVIIVVAFGQILPKEILELPKYGCMNVHASLFPKLRGAAPIQWAVINGDPYTGVSTQRMDEGVDTGDIILEEKVEIRPDETGGSLFDRLAEVGAELCVKTIEAIENGTAVYTPQDNSKATHTAKIHKELGSIDWTKSAKEIECLIRGLNPWPSAYTRLDGKTLKIWRANVLPDEKKAAPGCIIKAEKGSFLVQTGDGVLELLEVQLEGKKRMTTDAFLNGYTVEEGTYFTRG